MTLSDFGSPKADRASGSAVGMSPSGTGTFAYLRLCRVSRRRCSVWLSAVGYWCGRGVDGQYL